MVRPMRRPGAIADTFRRLKADANEAEIIEADRDPMVLTLPMPPSVNALYGRVNRDAIEARDAYKRDVARLCGRYRNPFAGPVAVVMEIYFERRGSDLSNRVKLTEDALNGICWVDDGQIEEAHQFKRIDRANPRVVVTVRAIGAIGAAKEGA